MNVLTQAKQSAILKALTEGVSIRAAARMVGVSKTTVLKLLVEVGDLCSVYQDHKLRQLPCQRIQVDEIWAFVGAKRKNAKREGDGDIWTFTAIDADSKLMVSWLVGERSLPNVHEFMNDLAGRLSNRVQVTTDGHYAYFGAIVGAFGREGVDYSLLIKHYRNAQHGQGGHYSPGVCTGVESRTMLGHPDPEHISTSFVERSNLSMRMGMRRFTRLTNAFSKKVENHAHAVALHFMVYNFCRAHGTLTKKARGVHTTPAMAAGVTNRVWTIEDLVQLLNPQFMIG